jgi:hypothetical protein
VMRPAAVAAGRALVAVFAVRPGSAESGWAGRIACPRAARVSPKAGKLSVKKRKSWRIDFELAAGRRVRLAIEVK